MNSLHSPVKGRAGQPSSSAFSPDRPTAALPSGILGCFLPGLGSPVLGTHPLLEESVWLGVRDVAVGAAGLWGGKSLCKAGGTILAGQARHPLPKALEGAIEI